MHVFYVRIPDAAEASSAQVQTDAWRMIDHRDLTLSACSVLHKVCMVIYLD